MSYSIAVIIMLLASLFYLVHADETRWHEFAIDHHCVIVGHSDGQVFNTILSNGTVGIGSTSDTTSYKCDDGIVYTR